MSDFQNPFVRGMLGGQAAANQNTAQQIGALGGFLNLQNAAEMKPLQLALLQNQVRNAEIANRFKSGLLGGTSPEPSQQRVFGEGGVSLPGGAQGNMQTGQVVPAAQVPQGQGGAYGIPPQVMGMIMSGDPGLMALGKAALEQQKPIVGREGAPILTRQPDGSLKPEFYAPKTEAGSMLQFGPNGQVSGVAPIPGQIGTSEALRGAEERGKARYDVMTVPSTGPNQPPTFNTRLNIANGAQPQVQPGMMTPGQINSIPNTNAPPIPPAQRAAQQIAFDQQPGRIPSSAVLPNAAGMSPADAAAQKANEQGKIETAKGRAEGGVKFEQGVLDSGRSARSNLTQLQILAPNLEKLPTGPLFPAMVSGAALFKQFGIDVPGLGKTMGEAQATQAVLNQLALKARSTAGGEGMPGAMSDADREFLVNTVPNLSKVPDGNRQLMKILMTVEQRKIDEAAIVNKMQSDGKTSNEIRDALSQFANSRKMFAQ